MVHALRLWVRRRLRKQGRKVGSLSSDFGDSIDKLFFRKMNKFTANRRFILGWLGLFVLIAGCLIAQLQSLSALYQTRQPVPGGIYTEGVLGSFTNANPVYATNEVDSTVSKLLFSSLFTFNDKNQVVGDLAKSWSVDATGKVYTVVLKDNLRWHDGEPLTADDVVFTYHVIQNPDAASPLRASWNGVTVAATDDKTVTFTLPSQLSSFVYTATNGILPKHLLETVSMAGMRSVGFNTTSPVGSGPFMWQDIRVEGSDVRSARSIIGLTPNPSYHHGKPKLRTFVVHTFSDYEQMIAAYKEGKITAMSGLEEVPKGMDEENANVFNFPVSAAKMVFFRTTTGVMTDVNVRKALVSAADPKQVMSLLSYQTRPVTQPLLMGQLGYSNQYAQKTNDAATANTLLDQAGWVMGDNGFRSKNGQRLGFALTAVDSPENRRVTKQLKADWKKVGADVTVDIQDELTFRTTVGAHAYEALLYSIAIGSDPDVFVYWHSSQADVRSASRLNLSEYNSKVVDEAVGSGRSRSDPTLRKVKYQTFLQQWQQDAPALGLYQPRSLYVTSIPVHGLREQVVNESEDRLNGVHEWMIRTALVTNERP